MLENFADRCSFQKMALAVSILASAAVLAGCAGVNTPSNSSLTQGGLAVAPANFDFQSVEIGQTATQPIQISNTTKNPIQISALSLSNTQFSLNSPPVPRVIQPLQTLTLTLGFAPTTEGDASGALQIAADSTKTPLSVHLAGTGKHTAAGLEVSPSTVDFGNLKLQSASTKNITLKNTGSTKVTLTSVTLTGGEFGFSNLSPGLSLPPNKNVTFQVWFRPLVQGQASGKLSIVSADAHSPAIVSLSGDGGSPASPGPGPSQHTVHLSWDASASSVIGYRVYRSEISGGPYLSLNGTALDVLSFDDSSVSSATTYYYVVSSVSHSGEESSYSNQTTAVIP